METSALRVDSFGNLLISTSRDGDLTQVLECITNDVYLDSADQQGKTALMHAAQNGHADVVELLINNNVNGEILDKTGMTALAYAVDNNFIEIVELLAEHGMGVKTRVRHHGPEPIPALYYACVKGYENIVKTLIKYGASGCTKSLITACEYNHVGTMKLLIDNGATVNYQEIHTGLNAFLVACKVGNGDAVNLLIASGADFSLTDINGENAVIKACQKDNRHVIEILVSLGADFDKEDHNGKTPLMHASETGSTNCIQYLLELGTNVNAVDKGYLSSLMYACKNGHLEAVMLLLLNDADVNLGVNKTVNWNHLNFLEVVCGRFGNWEKEKFVNTALMYSSLYGHENIVDVLISHGASVNAINSKGDTALILACTEKQTKVVEVILDKSKDLNIDTRDDADRTALMLACKQGMVQIVEALLSYGADPNLSTSWEETPLMFACSSRSLETVSVILKQQNIVIDQQDKSGKTALMYSAEIGDHDTVSFLLQNSANPDVRDSHGCSALYYTLRKSGVDFTDSNKCLEVLLSAGANTDVNNSGDHIYCIALSRHNLGAIKILYDKDCLLINGRLRKECRTVFYSLNRDVLSYIMELGLFEWDLCPLYPEMNIFQLFSIAIANGVSPGVIKNQYSYMKVFLVKKDLKTMELIIKNLYFYPEDYLILLKQKNLPENFVRSEIVQEFVTQPLSLFKWSFLSVSKAISLAGSPGSRRQIVDALPLPDGIKRRLKFKVD